MSQVPNRGYFVEPKSQSAGGSLNQAVRLPSRGRGRYQSILMSLPTGVLKN